MKANYAPRGERLLFDMQTMMVIYQGHYKGVG
jgi:hypothetical protein